MMLGRFDEGTVILIKNEEQQFTNLIKFSYKWEICFIQKGFVFIKSDIFKLK